MRFLQPSLSSTASRASSHVILKPALPLLGFSPKILGFMIESWVLGFLPEGLWLFLGFFQRPWVFLGFFHISPKIHLFKWFLAKSKEFVVDFGRKGVTI